MMKWGILLFFILVPTAFGYWEQFQYNENNAGKADGTGYIGTTGLTNITTFIDGTVYQPLVSDIDNDGKNEIVIFSLGNLTIFDSKLKVINEAFSGIIQGQPAIYNIDNDLFREIMFISNISNEAYFFAYEFDGFNIIQEFNLTIPGGAIGAGIKCTNAGEIALCIFMDNSQFVHIVNMPSKSEEAYKISNNKDTRERIPAIADLHNDGSKQAIFWFDNNSNKQYGLVSFDIINKTLDANFNKNGIIDDITVPYGVSGNNFILKGHPVIVDLNNDNKMEIAVSIFYDDSIPLFETFDWFTELFVFDHNGTKIFRKCEERSHSSPGNCNDGSSLADSWEGTNPFVLDANNDGMEDVCFIKDKKFFSGFKNMTINCYNYSGSKILDSELNPSDKTVKTAVVADMNSDGSLEIITENYIYALNGTAIYKHNFGSNYGIPVDTDGNGGLDFIVSRINQTIIFLDNFTYDYDLAISEKDIYFQKNMTKITIHNYGTGSVNNVEVLILNADTMENTTHEVDIPNNNNITISSNAGIGDAEYLLVQLDYDNKIEENDEKNNFASKQFESFPFVFVDVDLEPESLENEFKDYIKNSLKSGYYTNNENEASVKIYIGKNNMANRQKFPFTRNKFDYYYDFSSIYYKDETGTYPYNGLIGSFKENGIVYILIYGNEIDGTIAAAKEFIDKEADFINIEKDNSIFLDNENLNAIKIFDFLHNTGNEANYKADNGAFKQAVRNALMDEMFVEKDYTTISNSGITLRLRNLHPNASAMYLEYLKSSGVPVGTPVVLAHGLFSNLSTWQTLASEISNTGRDAWLIEITGGPGQDCESCPDYTFDDLISDYLPSLLNAVLANTGKEGIQYVGFSNGCRTALSSLEGGHFDPDKIETFIGVGCPGAFEGNSTLGAIIASKNGRISKKLSSTNLTHYNFETIAIASLLNREYIPEDSLNKISFNLWKFYENSITSNSDVQPGNFNIPIFIIIQGSGLGTNDGVVTMIDENKIFQSINNNGNTKKYFDIFALHTTLDKKDRTKSILKKSLNKQPLSFYEKTINLLNQTGED